MDVPKKLTARQQSQQEAQLTESQQRQAESARAFASVDEMLRHDALHTPVPPNIAVRLQESVKHEGLKPAPWWRRLLGGGNQ